MMPTVNAVDISGRSASSDPVEPETICPYCGATEVERKGDHWLCWRCQASWWAWNEDDKVFLKVNKIRP